MNKPITNYDKTIVRATALLDLFDTNPDIEETDDLVRSAVVLSVAGFDSYFTSKFIDILVPYLKKHRPSDELLSILEKAGLDSRTALELITMQRPFRRIRTLVQNSLSYYTTQRSDAIDKLFKSIGVKNLCKNAEQRSNRNNLVKRFSVLVKMRNEIAHAAHLNSHSKPKTINAADIRSRIADMNLFVHACDEFIGEK